METAMADAGNRANGRGRDGVEDVEFGYALWTTGKSTVVVKDSQVEHLKRYSFFDLIRSDLFGRAYPWTELIVAGRSELGQSNTRSAGIRSVVLTTLAWPALVLTPIWPGLFLLFVALARGVPALNSGLIAFVARERGPASMLTLFVHFTVCIIGLVPGLCTRSLPTNSRQRGDVYSTRKS